ncbi:MAG: hypothetical protein LQ342_000275 [Letrouitia transgressa]|nr:MAG: hypothetical protein LQ342_000275 [Letrouitia transgressa]
MVFGLGARRKQIGHNVYYIHTSGTSNVANQPITDKYDDSHVLSDIDNIYSFEKSRESSEPYPQRTADIAVVEAGLGLNVNTYIMMPPTIYGRGTGDFNKQTIQVPTIIRSALKTGQVEVVGNGSGIAGHVHVEDLALLYGTVLDQLLGGENIPHGKKGIYFAATGHHTWTELSQGIADALYQLGAIKTKEVKSIGLTEAAEKWAGGNELVTELNFAASYRTKPDLGGILGWKPQRTDEDFQHHYLDEVKLICSQEGKS